MALLVFGVWEAVSEVLGYEVTFWVNENDFFDVDLWVTGLQDTCSGSALGQLQIKWLQAHEVSLTVPTSFLLYPLGNRAPRSSWGK